MAASLIITETYFAICVVLLLATIFSRAVKRIVLIAATGIICVVSEAYLLFSMPDIRNTPGIFDRSFIATSFPLLIIALVLVSILVGLLLAFIYLVIGRHYPSPIAAAPLGADSEAVEHYRDANELYYMLNSAWLTFITIPLMPFTIFVSLVSASRDVVGGRSLFQEFFPNTSIGIMELDQAVALLAGMTMFGFSLYAAADERYRTWWETVKSRREEAARRRIDRSTVLEEWRRRHLALGRASEAATDDFELQNYRRSNL